MWVREGCASPGNWIKSPRPPSLSEKGKSFEKVLPESPCLGRKGRNEELWGEGAFGVASGRGAEKRKRKAARSCQGLGSAHLFVLGLGVWGGVGWVSDLGTWGREA